MSVSLDGYIEGPNREIDWHLLDEEVNAYVVEMLEAADVLVMGRKTYELMASFWPTAEGDDSSIKSFKDLDERQAQAGLLENPEEGGVAESRLAERNRLRGACPLKQTPGDGLICVGGSDLGGITARRRAP